MTVNISELAKELNLTVYVLRCYDEKSLIPFVNRTRTPSGTRLFKEFDMEALKIIQCLKFNGMPIKEMKGCIT